MDTQTSKPITITGMFDGKTVDLQTLEMDKSILYFGANGLQSDNGAVLNGEQLKITQALAPAKVDSHLATRSFSSLGMKRSTVNKALSPAPLTANTDANSDNNDNNGETGTEMKIMSSDTPTSTGGTRRRRNKKRMSRRKRASRRR